QAVATASVTKASATAAAPNAAGAIRRARITLDAIVTISVTPRANETQRTPVSVAARRLRDSTLPDSTEEDALRGTSYRRYGTGSRRRDISVFGDVYGASRSG